MWRTISGNKEIKNYIGIYEHEKFSPKNFTTRKISKRKFMYPKKFSTVFQLLEKFRSGFSPKKAFFCIVMGFYIAMFQVIRLCFR